MDDDGAIEMRTGFAHEASDRFGRIVPFHRGVIGEALKSREHARIVRALRDIITDGLRLGLAHSLDDGQQGVANEILCIRTRADDRGDCQHRMPFVASPANSKIRTNAARIGFAWRAVRS